MSNVIHLDFSPRQACLINKALKERAKHYGASDDQRRHALVSVGIRALREGRSTATAIALGNSDMRPRRALAAVGDHGPEAA